jgi:two-component system cell cycle response regulator DivK
MSDKIQNPQDPHKRRILIVEDEEELRNSLGRRFDRKGFHVLKAEGGIEAFEKLQSEPVDIVITDIRMAKGMGTELIDRIRNEMKDQRPVVICMSGFSDLTAETAQARGADALLPKPLDFEMLLQAVDHFSEQRQQRLDALKNSLK